MDRLLDIVITHYNEPYELVKPGLEMLKNQHNINWDIFRVTLLHDGTPHLDELKEERFPFEFRELSTYEHKGVAATRNYAITISDAKWITFFDCDDSLSSIYSLGMILQGINTDNFDFLWHSFYVTQPKTIGGPGKIDFFNLKWMCGKYFRLDFIRNHNIWFNEELCYAEDGAFDHFVYLECELERIGEIKAEFPLYAWIRRYKSATSDPEMLHRNILHGIKANVYISDLFKQHERPTARLMIARTITDAYVSVTRKDMASEPLDDIREEIIKFVKDNKHYLEQVSVKEWNYVLDASISESGSIKILNEDRKPFTEWCSEFFGGIDHE